MQPIVVLYLLWVLWFLTWLAVAIAGNTGPHKARAPFQFFYRLAILAATLLLFTITPWPGSDVQYRFWERELSDETGWALTAAAGAGFVLAWWATISRQIVGKRADGVVGRGPYRFVRHPVYLGLIIAAFATAAMFGRPSSSAGAVLFVAVFLIKIVVEERALRDDEPAYDEYAERVSMLLPIPKRSEAHGSVHRAAPSLRQSEPTRGFATPETPAPPSESAPNLPAKPVQLKLSLDVATNGSSAELTEVDIKP